MNANNHKSKLANPVKAQQPPLTGYPSQIQTTWLIPERGKKCQMKRNQVFSCISWSNLPCCMEPETCHVDSLLQLPNTGSAGVILGILKGRSSEQGVPAAARAAPTTKHRPLFFSQPKIFLRCLLTSISLRSGFPDFQRLTPLLNTLMIHCIYVGM